MGIMIAIFGILILACLNGDLTVELLCLLWRLILIAGAVFLLVTALGVMGIAVTDYQTHGPNSTTAAAAER